MIFHLSTPFPHLATKFITLEVTRVAERGFVTLEGLLDQEIASVIHKDFSHTVPTSSPGSVWGIFHTDTTFLNVTSKIPKNHKNRLSQGGVAPFFDVES